MARVQETAGLVDAGIVAADGGELARRRVGKVEQQRQRGVPVEEQMVRLVGVGEKAVVAGLLASLRNTPRAATIRPVGSVVEQGKGVSRDGGEVRRIVLDELAQYARAAFGRFVQQDPAPLRPARQRLGGQLVVLEIEDDLDAALERPLQAR